MKWVIDETKPIDSKTLEKSIPSTNEFRRMRGSKASLAVRINDVVIHDTKKWFGGADIRLDAMVVQGLPPEKEDMSFYRPSTFRFSGIKDGDRLPIDEPGLLVFYGQPAYFLDISFLVSRDRKDTDELSKLISDEVKSDSWKSATSSILGLALAVPQVSMLNAALIGATTIANVAWKILRKMTGDTIGLYRVSWLQKLDRFGIGRHPESGTYRHKGLEFWYEIVVDVES